MNNKFTSRKFFLVVVTQLLLFLCLATGTLPADVFQSITMVLVSGYLASNVVQKATTKEVKDESKV